MKVTLNSISESPPHFYFFHGGVGGGNDGRIGGGDNGSVNGGGGDVGEEKNIRIEEEETIELN